MIQHSAPTVLFHRRRTWNVCGLSSTSSPNAPILLYFLRVLGVLCGAPCGSKITCTKTLKNIHHRVHREHREKRQRKARRIGTNTLTQLAIKAIAVAISDRRKSASGLVELILNILRNELGHNQKLNPSLRSAIRPSSTVTRRTHPSVFPSCPRSPLWWSPPRSEDHRH